MTSPQPTPPFQLTKALLCLGAAALFWFLNALNKTGYSRNVEYPIRFVYDRNQYVPTAPLPRTVQVNVSGDGWGLLGQSWLPLRTEPVDYIVKDPLRASVINTGSLTAALAEHIKQLHVNYVVADTLDLAFDRRLTKTVRLVPDSLHFDLAPGYAVSSVINLTPRIVTIEGPAKLVRGLPDSVLIRVPRKRIAVNYDEDVPLNPFRHPLLRASADHVTVSFEVDELLSPAVSTAAASTAAASASTTSGSGRP